MLLQTEKNRATFVVAPVPFGRIASRWRPRVFKQTPHPPGTSSHSRGGQRRDVLGVCGPRVFEGPAETREGEHNVAAVFGLRVHQEISFDRPESKGRANNEK